jgi:hypothetical protein
MMTVGLLAYLGCILLAAAGISFHHYLWALILLGVGWASLLMVAVPLLVLHALLMAAWLVRRQPAEAGGRSSPR